MIFHVETPMDPQQNLQELISQGKQISRFKVNTQKSAVLLHLSDKQLKKNSICNRSKKGIKFLGITLFNEMEGLDIGNYKILLTGLLLQHST